MEADKIERYNETILEKLSCYLNFTNDFIKSDVVDKLSEECNIEKKDAFSILLAQACGIDVGRSKEELEMFEKYFPYMIHQLNKKEYEENPYYKNIKIPQVKNEKWTLKNEEYKPYEAFVFNDLKELADGRIIPQIGFFDCEFKYPAVLENDREWMLITPNEIETMKVPIERASGKVLTYGLGLGYYAYMVSRKLDVSSVTIVENDESVIKLFEKYILPQFPMKNKIKIVHQDAFIYAEKYMEKEKFDFVFTDIWHDPSDGIEKYLKMKKYEKLNTDSTYMYWIEKTMKYYMD